MTIQEFRRRLRDLTQEAIRADLAWFRIINALDMQKTMTFYHWMAEEDIGKGEEFFDKRYFEE